MADVRRPVIALLESRMSLELARLVEKHGGQPLCVPVLVERPALDALTAERVVRDLCAGRYQLVVFMTGLAVSMLFEMADPMGLRAELVAALQRATTLCRGPKPMAALRGFGVPPTITARSAFTSAEVVDALAAVDVADRAALLFHYGERSDTVAETLLARRAHLTELWLYRWLMPDDTSPVEDLIARILHFRVDALAITCQIQFRHLLEVATRLHQRRDLVDALNDRTVVAAVGPTCQAILEAHGVGVRVLPESPKMGPLIVALMRHLARQRPHELGEGFPLPN